MLEEEECVADFGVIENTEMPQQHPLKVAGPHQLNRRRQQQTVEQMFPHIAATHQQIRNALPIVGLGTLQEKLMKIIRFYKSGCRKEYENVSLSTQKCRRLARSMLGTMYLLREKCSIFWDSTEYIQHMSELVAIYVSCELRSANEFKEDKSLISHRICINIYKYLKAGNNEDTKSNILRMFAYMPSMHKEREVMTKIFQFFIPKEQIIMQRELPDKLFIQYLIVFYHWTKLEECDEEEQPRVIEFANQFMRPAKTLCFNSLYAKHLPKYEKRRIATKFCLQNLKFFQDLRKASIYDHQLHFGPGIIDLSDEDETIEKPVVNDDFADVVKSVGSTIRAPPIKLEKQKVTETIDLTLEDDADDKKKETAWLETLKENARELEVSQKILAMLAARTAALTGSSKNKSTEIIELDSDSDLDLEEPEHISSNYLDLEFDTIDDCAIYEEDLSNSSLGDDNSNKNLKTAAAIEDSSTVCSTVDKSSAPSKTLTQTAVPNASVNANQVTLSDLQDTQINPKIAEVCNSTTTSSEQQQQQQQQQQQSVTQFTMPHIVDSYTWRRNSIHISSSPTNNNETDLTLADRNSDSDEVETDGECTNKCAGTKQFNSSKVIFSQTPSGSLQHDAIDFDVEDMALNTRTSDKPNQKKQVKFHDSLIVSPRATTVQHPIKSAIKTTKHNSQQSIQTIFSTQPLQRFGCVSPASSTSSNSEKRKQIALKGMKTNSLNKLKTNDELHHISINSTQPTIDNDNPIEIIKDGSKIPIPISNSNNIKNKNLNEVLSSNSCCKNVVEENIDVTQAADISSTNCHVHVDSNCMLNVNNNEIIKQNVQENYVESIGNYDNILQVSKESENSKVNNISSTYVSQDLNSQETEIEILKQKVNKNSGSVFENELKVVNTTMQSTQSEKANEDFTERGKTVNEIVDDNEINQLCCVSTSSNSKENMQAQDVEIAVNELVLDTNNSLSNLKEKINKTPPDAPEKEDESCEEVSTSCAVENVNIDIENDTILNKSFENASDNADDEAVVTSLPKENSNLNEPTHNEHNELEIQRVEKTNCEHLCNISNGKNLIEETAIIEIKSQSSEEKSAVSATKHVDDVLDTYDMKKSDNLIPAKDQVKTEDEYKNNIMQEVDEKTSKATYDEHKSEVIVVQSMPENIMNHMTSVKGSDDEKATESKDRCAVNILNENDAPNQTELDKIIAEDKINTEVDNEISNNSVPLKENPQESITNTNFQEDSEYAGTSTKIAEDNFNSEDSGQYQLNLEKNKVKNVSQQDETINNPVIKVKELLNESTQIFNENINIHDVAYSSKSEGISSNQDKGDVLLHDIAIGVKEDLKECGKKDHTSDCTSQLDKKQSEVYSDIANSSINSDIEIADIDLSDNIELHVRNETSKGTNMKELVQLGAAIRKEDHSAENANIKSNVYEKVINQNPQILNIVTKCMDIEKLEENIKTMRRELQLELEEWNETTKEFIIQQQSTEEAKTVDAVKHVDVNVEEPTDFYGLEEFLILRKRRASQENSDNLAIDDNEFNEDGFSSNVSKIASYTPPYTCVDSSSITKTFLNQNVELDAPKAATTTKSSGANAISNERERNECEIDSDLEFDFDFVFGLDFDSMTPTSTAQNITTTTKELYNDKSFLNENSKTYEAEKLLEQFNVATENIVESVLKTNEKDEPCLTSSNNVTSSDDCSSTSSSSSSSSSSCTSSCSCSTCISSISSTVNHDGVSPKNNDNVVLGPLELENELLLNADDLLPSSELITDSELLQEFVTIPSMGTKSAKSSVQIESSKITEEDITEIPTLPISEENIRLNEDSQLNDYEITWHSGQNNIENAALDDVFHESGIKPSLLVSIPTKNLKNLKTLNLTPSSMGQENKKQTQDLTEVLETSTQRSLVSVSDNKKSSVGIDNQETSDGIKGILFRVTAPKRRISDFSIMQLIGLSEEQAATEIYNKSVKVETKEGEGDSMSLETTTATTPNGATATADLKNLNNVQYEECNDLPISRRVLIRNIMNASSPFIDQQQVEISLPLKKRRKLSEFHDESNANSNTATLTEEEDTDTDDNLIVLEASNGVRTATHLRRSAANSANKADSATASTTDESQTVYVVVQSVTVKSPEERAKETALDANKIKQNSQFSNLQESSQSQIDTFLPTAQKNSLDLSLCKEQQDMTSSTAITLNQPAPQSKPILLPTNSSPPQNKQIQVVIPQIKEIPKAVVDSGNVTLSSIPESYPAEPMLSIANFENLVHLQKYLDSLIASKHLAKTIDAAIAVMHIFSDFHEQDKRQNLMAEINKITSTSEIVDAEKLLLKIQLDGSISTLVDNNSVNEWIRLPPATAALLTKAATTLAKLENYKKQVEIQTNLFVQPTPQELQLALCNRKISIPEAVNTTAGDNLLQMQTNDLINKILPLQRNLQLPKKDIMLLDLQLAEIRIKQEQNKQNVFPTNLREIQTATVLPLAAQLSLERNSIPENFCTTAAPNSSASIVQQQQQQHTFATQQSNVQHFAEHTFPVSSSADDRYSPKREQKMTEELIDHHIGKVIEAQQTTNLTFSQTKEKLDYVSSRHHQTVIKEEPDDLTPFFTASSNCSTINTLQAKQDSTTEHVLEQRTIAAPARDINLNHTINEANSINQYFPNAIEREKTATSTHNSIEYPKTFGFTISDIDLEQRNPHKFEQPNYMNTSSMSALQQQLQLPTVATTATKPTVENDETIDISQLKIPYPNTSESYQPFCSSTTQSHNSNKFDVEPKKSSLESTRMKDFEYYTFEQQHQRHMLMLEKRKQFEQMMNQREAAQQQRQKQRKLEEEHRKQREIMEQQRKQQRELEAYEELQRNCQEYQKRERENQQLIEEENFRKLHKNNFEYNESQHNIYPNKQMAAAAAASQGSQQFEWLQKTKKRQQQSYQQQMEEFVRLQQHFPPFPSLTQTKISSPTPEASRTHQQHSTEQPKKRRGRQAKKTPSLTLNLITNINNTTTIDFQNTFSKINTTTSAPPPPPPPTQTPMSQSYSPKTATPRKRGRPRKTQVNIEPSTTATKSHCFKQTAAAPPLPPISPTIPNISFSNMLYPPPPPLLTSTRTTAASTTSSTAQYNSYSIYTPLSNFPMPELAPILTNVAIHESPPLPRKRRRATKTSSPKKM